MKVITHTDEMQPCLKPREGRVVPARMLRLTQAEGNAFRYDEERWTGLPARIANAYVRGEDKAKDVIRGADNDVSPL